jgi:myo-inositol-1(or 4)-monophosphatase
VRDDLDFLRVAKDAAVAGGRLLRSLYRPFGTASRDFKAVNDYVSEADSASERAVLDVITNAYPDHAIVAEESGEQGESAFQWLVDPLDGTANFVHGHPAFSVSVALCRDNTTLLGVVFDPMREELFWAERGCGAFMNAMPVHVSGTTTLARAFLATGFPFRAHADLDNYLRVFRRLFAATSGTRRAGSAALDLSYVACGRFDAFWEFYLKPWDTAAGGMIVSEAGGTVTDIFGGPGYREAGHVMASNGAVHAAMLDHVRAALRGRALRGAPSGYRAPTHESPARLP